MNKFNFIYLFVFIIIQAISVLSADSSCPKIKTRRNWGGSPAKSVDYQIIPVNYVIIHHTVGNKCSRFGACANEVQNIQAYHMQGLGYDDIGYNFLIGNDGNVYEGVGWHKIGAHTLGYNSKSIAIAFMGDFSSELPTTEALESAKKLLNCGIERGELDANYKLLGGKQVSPTESPGLELYSEIQDWDNWSASP